MFEFDVPSAIMKSVRHFDRTDLVDKFVGLSLCPEYQSNHLRILTLIHVALVHASGRDFASRVDLAAMLNGLRNHESGQNEDPAEDVFVSGVSTAAGQYRIFNGIYPASDFSLQRLLDAVFSQTFSEREKLSAQSQALLTLSETLADRCGLHRNAFEPSERLRTRWPIMPSKLLELGRATHFSIDDLAALGIERDVLDPFCLDSVEGLLEAPFGATALVRRPLLVEGSPR
jgi:hypothetical protein